MLFVVVGCERGAVRSRVRGCGGGINTDGRRPSPTQTPTCRDRVRVGNRTAVYVAIETVTLADLSGNDLLDISSVTQATEDNVELI